MKKNLDVSERIAHIIDNQFNGNKKKFAESIGYSAQVVSNIVSGRKSKPSYDVLKAIISTNDEIDSEWLLTGKGSMVKESREPKAIPSEEGVPLLPYEAFAGMGDTNVSGVDFNTIEERYVVPLFEGIKIDFMLSVRGSSMYPKYNSGDVVACRMVTDLLFIQWNKVYVIDTFSQGVIMKRLKKSKDPDSVICKSDNASYDSFELPRKEMRNIALVVGVIRLE